MWFNKKQLLATHHYETYAKTIQLLSENNIPYRQKRSFGTFTLLHGRTSPLLQENRRQTFYIYVHKEDFDYAKHILTLKARD